MTIGEKVVAWQERYRDSDTGKWLSWRTCSQYTHESYVEAGHNFPEYETRALIPQSAYAELAAELEARTRALVKMTQDVDTQAGLLREVLPKLQAAESQLAELRGDVLEIDALMRKDIAEFGGCLKLVNRLRELAAADGGGSSG